MAVAGRTTWGDSDGRSREGYAAFYTRHGFDIDAQHPGQTVLFPEMDETAEVPEITTACWDILNKSPERCHVCLVTDGGETQRVPNARWCWPVPFWPTIPNSELGETLAEAETSVALNHPHCAKFCVLGGASCSA